MANLKEQLARKLSTLDFPTIEQTTEQEAEIMAKDTDVIQLRPQTDNLPAALDAAPHFVVTFAEAKHRLQQLQQFISEFMKPGVDYGIVPGTDKPTLLKPGAEKLCEIYGFSKWVEILHQTEDYDRPLFAYTVKVRLASKTEGFTEAEGVGAANSREKKFLKQDPFTIQNTLLKMAKKRALVDAVLSATRSSGLFTQDIEDLDLPQPIAAPKPQPAAAAPPTSVPTPTCPPTAPPKPVEPVKIAPTQPPAVNPAAAATPMTDRQRNMIQSLMRKKRFDSDALETILVEVFGRSDRTSLNKNEASKLIDYLLTSN